MLRDTPSARQQGAATPGWPVPDAAACGSPCHSDCNTACSVRTHNLRNCPHTHTYYLHTIAHCQCGVSKAKGPGKGVALLAQTQDQCCTSTTVLLPGAAGLTAVLPTGCVEACVQGQGTQLVPTTSSYRHEETSSTQHARAQPKPSKVPSEGRRL